MPEYPLSINGVTRLVWLDPMSEDTWNATLHQYRRLGVVKRRSYYEGSQYDGDNYETKKTEFAGCSEAELLGKWLPEHKRKHAYSSSIKEGVDFLADQVTGNMQVEMSATGLQDLIDQLFHEMMMDTRRQEITRELLIAGDVFAQFKALPIRSVMEPDMPAVKVDFWEAESVEVDYDEDDWEKMAEVRYEVTRTERRTPDSSLEEVKYRHVFRLDPIVTPDGVAREEAVERVYREDEEDPVEVNRLGMPFLPWVHIHGEQEQLRSKYGRPMISQALMDTADRFNATSHLEFLALRYNSFGNLAVVGDAAQLKIDQAGAVGKDLADVLAFPGGTGVHTISLTINTEAFAQQKDQLQTQMFEIMGLTRIDDTTMSGLGDLSGYALEILNRKNDGTFRKVVENLGSGLQELIDMALKVDAFARATPGTDEDGSPILMWWLVDPDVKYPDRMSEVRFGTAYIVDEVEVRNDFIAGIISQEEALRQKGYDEEQIKRILDEMAAQAEQQEALLSARLEAGTNFSTERG